MGGDLENPESQLAFLLVGLKTLAISLDHVIKSRDGVTRCQGNPDKTINRTRYHKKNEVCFFYFRIFSSKFSEIEISHTKISQQIS